MAIKRLFSLMCDEVRVENNGKFIILGVYTPDMAVPQLPFVAPVLTFVLWLDSNIPGNYQFSAKLTHLESGNMVAQAMGGMGIPRPGVGLVPIRLVGVPFNQAGSYIFSMNVQNEEEMLHQFSVLLPTPGASGMPGFPKIGN